MRIKSIFAQNAVPIERFQVENLSDVVVLAGPNGVGKTRLIEQIIHAIQSPVGHPNVRLVLEATNRHEREIWQAGELDPSTQEGGRKLMSLLQGHRRRGKWTSSLIRFESDRSIQKIQPYQFQWDVGDPSEEAPGWNVTFQPLKNRFQDTLHSIFRRVQARRNKISKHAEELMRSGEKFMTLDFPDPLEEFREAFRMLLGPKELVDADLQGQQLKYSTDDQELPLASLSSGEREVVNIVFDFILRNPSHSIVIFDEPELHLHPELSFKLLQTLQTVGESNQFFFCTHSPDIITASLDHSVIFIAPANINSSNQAVVVTEDDETNQALRLLGHSIGVIALGRKVVLIEGSEASLDKQVYGMILENRFPSLVLVPCGGKGTIQSFEFIQQQVLNKSLWGVDFFMLCDQDAFPSGRKEGQQNKNTERLKILNRYHLENYFLDPDLLSSVFIEMEAEDSWLRSPEEIERALSELGRDLASYAAALHAAAEVRNLAGNIDLMVKSCHGISLDALVAMFVERAKSEASRIGETLNATEIEACVTRHYERITDSLNSNDGAWKTLIPGKPLLRKFASSANIHQSRLRRMYLSQAKKVEFRPFHDVIETFRHFDNLANPGT